MFLGLAVLVCGSENSRYQFRVPPNKRGLSLTFPSHGSSSYSAPHLGIPSSVSSGYNLGGSSGGFSLGHAGLSLGGSIGHGIAYSQPSTGGFGSGYVSSGLDHNSLSLQGASLNGHSAQSSYSVPSITSIGLGSGGGSNLISSKTGPVTFGSQSGSDAASSSYSGSGSYSSAPVYATAAQGLSAYNNGGSTVPVVLGSSHDSSSSYSLPQSISSNSLHSVTGGLIIASGSHDGSSSYSLPASKPSYGISALSSSSGSHGASPTYSLPITSGPHEISSSSSSSYSPSVSSGSYGSSSSHAGFSTSASDSSNYEPISSGSYSNSGSSSPSYVNYVPSHSSGSSSSYSSPSVIYGSPSSSSSGYSDSGSSYAAHSSSYASPSHSYSNPVVTYAKASSYTPTYLSPSGSYGTSTGSHGAYSSVQSPRYSRLAAIKSYDNAQLESKKYDTISYSIPNGK